MSKDKRDKVKDLLNQIAIELRDEKEPTVDTDDDDYGGYQNLICFESTTSDKMLPSIKVVVEAMLNDLEKNPKYSSQSEKMARAYYTSFCNA